MKQRFVLLIGLVCLPTQAFGQAPSVPPPVAATSTQLLQPSLLPPLLDVTPPEPTEPVGEAEPGEPVLPSPWARVPPTRIFPRPGAFFVPPREPGYYSMVDFLTGHSRPAPPQFPYPPFGFIAFSFFDADFRYLEKPDNAQHDFFDPIKRMKLGDDWLWSVGGDFRTRYANELNQRLQLTANRPGTNTPARLGTHNDYNLLRTRVFSDLWYQDMFRVYVEYLDAQSLSPDLAPLAIDVNHSDLLNAFVDVKIAEIADKQAYLRVGRQELLLGSQRLLSPLDWANTRRTYQGVRGFRQGHEWDVDLFWMQPVIPNPTQFDSISDAQNLFGAWLTHRPKKGTFIDLYYLNFSNAEPAAPPSPPAAAGTRTPGFYTNTVGTRYVSDFQNEILWDVEAAFQTGARGTQTILAGMLSTGVGYHFADSPMHPQVWLYYDYASGDRSPGRGDTFEGFNQVFPFGHYYLGFLDVVARSNIHDINGQFGIYPLPWILCMAQLHHFELASRTGGLFNAAGALVRTDPTGNAGTDVGNELDLLVNFHIDAHQDFLLGYSKLYPGRFLEKTGSNFAPELFYVQYQYRW